MTATITTPETTPVEDACRRLGISRATGYGEIQRTGQLAGIPVVRVGRRVLIPTAALDRVLIAPDGGRDDFHVHP